MSTTAQYASVLKAAVVALTATANAARDGTGVISHVVSSGPNGSRIDKLNLQALGTTTAGMVRLYVVKGKVGPGISGIVFSGTTATVTTASAHGQVNGQKVTVQNAYPDEYNVVDAVITVTGPTTYAYVMASAPTTNATVPGFYFWLPATIVPILWKEIPISANVPSATVPVFSVTGASSAPSDNGFLPLQLPAGCSLRASTNNAEAFALHATVGDY